MKYFIFTLMILASCGGHDEFTQTATTPMPVLPTVKPTTLPLILATPTIKATPTVAKVVPTSTPIGTPTSAPKATPVDHDCQSKTNPKCE